MSDEAPFEVESFLKSLTQRPGVYRMLDAKHRVIYVGKARDLKKRVSSYFTRSRQAPKTAAALIKRADRIAAYLEATPLAGFAPEEARRVFGAGRTVDYEGVETLSVDGAEGDDPDEGGGSEPPPDVRWHDDVYTCRETH